MGYALRFIMINALLIVSFVQIQRAGKVTNKTIALYIGMALVANVLMYLGAQARTRMQNRRTR
jgi:hypothetical protein